MILGSTPRVATNQGVRKLVSPTSLGQRKRKFESYHPDHYIQNDKPDEIYNCVYSSMDRTSDCGSEDIGPIPIIHPKLV